MPLNRPLFPFKTDRAEPYAFWRDPAFAVAVGLFAFAVVFTTVAAVFDVHISVLVRDPASQYAFPRYAGAISHAGIALLTSTAACTLMAAALRAPRWRALLAAGVFSGALAFDDLFLVHEIGPRLWEATIFAFYGLAALLIARELRREGAGVTLTGLKIAIVFLGLSVVTDIFKVYGPFAYWLEDFSKLAGFGAWATFWIGLSARGLRPAA